MGGRFASTRPNVIMPALIPLHLRLSGFLSYRDTAELDFKGFDLACISGPNGAGKSSLLDAITWSLFGQARRRDEALINQQSEAAEVALIFRYEGTDYRVQRSLRRGKPTALEFQARSPVDNGAESVWKPLTERTLRDTQGRIEQVLRLDYDTFVNASFFLQGKADLFAQQPPTRRKDVLGNVLGLEVWETYKARTADLRRQKETELSSLAARLGDIEAELAEEPQRRQRLEALEVDLSRAVSERKLQASTLEAARKTHAVIDRQRSLLSEQSSSLERLQRELAALQTRRADRQRALDEGARLTARADEIEAAYWSWRHAREELSRWDTTARSFADHERKRTPLLQAIAAEQARLSQERSQLATRRGQVEALTASTAELKQESELAAGLLADAERRLQERQDRQAALAAQRESIAEKTAENKALKDKMDELKGRIETLQAAEDASCPLCGQALTEQHRKSTLARLQAEGKQFGDTYRRNTAESRNLGDSISRLEAELSSTDTFDQQRLEASRRVTQLAERLHTAQSERAVWEADGKVRLAEVDRVLESGEFAGEVKSQLARVDSELAALGYDAVAHDRARHTELSLRAAEEDRQNLLTARAALAPLENEIASLGAQIAERRAAAEAQRVEVERLESDLQSAGADLPDLAAAEAALFELQERENRLNQDLGAARQKVTVLQDLRQRSAEFSADRQALALVIGRHRALEAALGKDGVQALLIEQALPELETRANAILDRLSDGRMSVHFETQAPYRDRKRDDLKETLEIKISDGAGQRDYEMYSGGEAFRVNFAIRLALSQLLAGRKGARLQTLVIDEGFGSQDNQGRQRLIETINLIRHDFAKVLLISHLDELKDAFPTRIEVEKTERGSSLKVS